MKVSVIMGSKSDWDVMSAACQTLEEFGVSYEKKVISAHRTPQFFCEYMASARDRGVGIVIAGAGGAEGRLKFCVKNLFSLFLTEFFKSGSKCTVLKSENRDSVQRSILRSVYRHGSYRNAGRHLNDGEKGVKSV